MGTYGVSAQELVGELTECLDNIEGDFTTQELSEALDFLKGYCPTIDSTKKQEKWWRKKLEDLK